MLKDDLEFEFNGFPDERLKGIIASQPEHSEPVRAAKAILKEREEGSPDAEEPKGWG